MTRISPTEPFLVIPRTFPSAATSTITVLHLTPVASFSHRYISKLERGKVTRHPIVDSLLRSYVHTNESNQQPSTRLIGSKILRLSDSHTPANPHPSNLGETQRFGSHLEFSSVADPGIFHRISGRYFFKFSTWLWGPDTAFTCFEAG